MAEKFQVGQPVKVYQSYLRSTQDGKIVRVGRTLVDIQVGAYQNVRQYRIADQRWNSKEHSSGSYFRTIEQFEAAERRISAVKRLEAFGCRFDLGSRSVPVEKLERIADVLEEPC